MIDSESSVHPAFRNPSQISISEKVDEAQYDKRHEESEADKKSPASGSLNNLKRPPERPMTPKEVKEKFPS